MIEFRLSYKATKKETYGGGAYDIPERRCPKYAYFLPVGESLINLRTATYTLFIVNYIMSAHRTNACSSIGLRQARGL